MVQTRGTRRLAIEVEAAGNYANNRPTLANTSSRERASAFVRFQAHSATHQNLPLARASDNGTVYRR